MAMNQPNEVIEGESFDADGSHELLAQCLDRLALEGEPAVEAICREHPQLAGTVRAHVKILRQIGLHGSARDQDSNFPERLGDFRLLRRLGSGGMGVVYLAKQESLNREVALKLVRP